MSPRQVELALAKQRLQLRSAALRSEWAGHVAVLHPLCAAGDRLRAGTAWLRAHPELVVATAVARLVARPRRAWRWLRRGVVVWQGWNRLRRWIESRRAEAA